jgi:hypothetical protein
VRSQQGGVALIKANGLSDLVEAMIEVLWNNGIGMNEEGIPKPIFIDALRVEVQIHVH